MKRSQILVGIIMGSQSDWPVMKHASDILNRLSINHEKKGETFAATSHVFIRILLGLLFRFL